MSSQNIVPPSNSLVKYAHPVLVSTSGKRKDQPSQINQHTEDILNSILPPREYTMDKQQLWIQSVLPTPATKADVMQLQEDLDKRLQQRQARETGKFISQRGVLVIRNLSGQRGTLCTVFRWVDQVDYYQLCGKGTVARKGERWNKNDDLGK